MRGNLFVVTRVGQLRNVQSFIKEYSAQDNYLAILLTEANPVLADNIEANVEGELFDEIVRIWQPVRPLDQRRTKNKVIYRQIEELLLTMCNERGVSNLFLCNSDAYYGFFERVKQVHRLELSLSFLEEGLGTYANAGVRRYQLDAAANWTDVVHRAGNFGRSVRQAFRLFGILAVTGASWVLRTDVIRFMKDLITKLTVPERYRFSSIEHFDTAYVYFPDKIHSANMRIDAVHKLGFVVDRSGPRELVDSIEDSATVFVSQKYVPYQDYFDIVFEILTEMGVGCVHFKFHPREDPAAYVKAWTLALREHPRLDVVTADEMQAVPVEELMIAGKVKRLIGLTSTSLLYAGAFFPDVEVVSIGARFKELAESDQHDLPKRVLAEFNRDLEVFLDVSEVRQF